jgi:hypothetical protein
LQLKLGATLHNVDEAVAETGVVFNDQNSNFGSGLNDENSRLCSQSGILSRRLMLQITGFRADPPSLLPVITV